MHIFAGVVCAVICNGSPISNRGLPTFEPGWRRIAAIWSSTRCRASAFKAATSVVKLLLPKFAVICTWAAL